MITEPGITKGLRTSSEQIRLSRQQELYLDSIDHSAPGLPGH